MGEVIRFPIERVRRTIGQSSDRIKNASILVFEGVRYSTFEQENHQNIVRPAAEPQK